MRFLIDGDNKRGKLMLTDIKRFSRDNFLPIYIDYKKSTELPFCSEGKIHEDNQQYFHLKELGLYHRQLAKNTKNTQKSLYLCVREVIIPVVNGTFAEDAAKRTKTVYNFVDLTLQFSEHYTVPIGDANFTNSQFDKDFSEKVSNYFKETFGTTFNTDQEVFNALALYHECGTYSLTSPKLQTILDSSKTSNGTYDKSLILREYLKDTSIIKSFTNYLEGCYDFFSHFSSRHNQKDTLNAVKTEATFKYYSQVDTNAVLPDTFKKPGNLNYPKVSEVVLQKILLGNIPIFLSLKSSVDLLKSNIGDKYGKPFTTEERFYMDPYDILKIRILNIIKYFASILLQQEKAPQDIKQFLAYCKNGYDTTNVNLFYNNATTTSDSSLDSVFSLIYIPVIVYDYLLRVYYKEPYNKNTEVRSIDLLLKMLTLAN